MVIGIEKGMRSRKYADAARKIDIPYVLIDCTRNNAIEKIKKVDAFIWHWTQDKYADKKIAPSIIKCAEIMGKIVYPNTNTCWMFDDKAAERYLLEAINAPLIDTFMFYDELSAMKWLEKQKYPIVYKLPQGAGSINVRLIHNYEEGKKVCKSHFEALKNPALAMRLHDAEKKDYLNILIASTKDSKILYGVNNKGSILFQKYLPDNQYDVRVTVIGEKSIIFRRFVRDNDFRASGSGKIDYNVTEQDLQAIPIAQEVAKNINSQSMAFDFLYDNEKNLKINEISYGFDAKAVFAAGGWYDEYLCFHKDSVDIHEEVLKSIKEMFEEK